MIQEPVSMRTVNLIVVYLAMLIILNNVPEKYLAPLIVSRPNVAACSSILFSIYSLTIFKTM